MTNYLDTSVAVAVLEGNVPARAWFKEAVGGRGVEVLAVRERARHERRVPVVEDGEAAREGGCEASATAAVHATAC